MGQARIRASKPEQRTSHDHSHPYPLPAGATRAEEWEVNTDGSITRWFHGTIRNRDRWYIGIVGEQDYSGEVLSRVAFVNTVKICEGELGVADPREIAADLLAAADELDALSGPVADVIELPA